MSVSLSGGTVVLFVDSFDMRNKVAYDTYKSIAELFSTTDVSAFVEKNIFIVNDVWLCQHHYFYIHSKQYRFF